VRPKKSSCFIQAIAAMEKVAKMVITARAMALTIAIAAKPRITVPKILQSITRRTTGIATPLVLVQLRRAAGTVVETRPGPSTRRQLL
jgi:hypothetical protein